VEVDQVTIEQHLLGGEYTHYLEYAKMDSGEYMALHSSKAGQQ
jgi:hypothetical protein